MQDGSSALEGNRLYGILQQGSSDISNFSSLAEIYESKCFFVLAMYIWHRSISNVLNGEH